VFPTHKLCKHCGQVKEISDFGKLKTSSDGHRSQCLKCRRAAQSKKYAEDVSFREKELARFATLYVRDKPKITKRINKWRSVNPNKLLQITNRRRAVKFNRIIEEFDKADIVAAYNNICVYCGETRSKMHMDHIIPFCRGGHHMVSNIVLACQNCNCSKHTKTLVEWARHILILLDSITDMAIVARYEVIVHNILDQLDMITIIDEIITPLPKLYKRKIGAVTNIMEMN
jgi:HNH endonuclease